MFEFTHIFKVNTLRSNEVVLITSVLFDRFLFYILGPKKSKKAQLFATRAHRQYRALQLTLRFKITPQQYCYHLQFVLALQIQHAAQCHINLAFTFKIETFASIVSGFVCLSRPQFPYIIDLVMYVLSVIMLISLRRKAILVLLLQLLTDSVALPLCSDSCNMIPCPF